MKFIEINEITQFSPMKTVKRVIEAGRIGVMTTRIPDNPKDQKYTHLVYESKVDAYQSLRVTESTDEIAMLCGVTIKRLGA